MTRSRRMIAVGGICVTDIYRVESIPEVPAKVLASAMCRVVDGMAVSAACSFVRLGGTARAWARIGDDADGDAARDALRQEGLDVSGLHAVPGSRSSHATVIVDAVGRRLVVPFHDHRTDPSPSWLPLEALADADMLHCDVRWPDGAEHALRAARARGVATMLDGDIGPPDVLHRLVPLADYAVFSDAGLLACTGMNDVEAALLHVAAAHPGHVGATCGSEGYCWVEEGGIRRMAAPAVDVIDTLAAGDVFHGALAVAILEGMSMDAAARFACTAAALKCTRFGGRLGCPTRDEVDRALAGQGG